METKQRKAGGINHLFLPKFKSSPKIPLFQNSVYIFSPNVFSEYSHYFGLFKICTLESMKHAEFSVYVY